VNVRKVIFWLHLTGGIAAGILVLIMSLTGVALTYQKQMTTWADKRIHRVEPPADQAPLSAELLLRKLEEARPSVIPASVTLSSDPEMPASVTTGPNQTIFVNQYTGEILGTGSQAIRVFFRLMTDWHRWLALSGESRSIGRAVTGAGNLVFLIISLTGLYLWLPKRWSFSSLRAMAWFRSGAKGKMRDSNWHNVFGVWCVIPLVVIIASGVVISYPWASNLVFRLAGSDAPPRMGPGGRRGGPPMARIEAPLQIEGVDRLLSKAQQYSNNWKTITFQPSALNGKTVSFAVERGYGGQPQHRATLTLDRTTAEIVRVEDFGKMDPGMKARMWMRFAHTGEYYGLAGQTVAGIVSAGAVILVWTGIALTFRRYAAWLKRRVNEP